MLLASRVPVQALRAALRSLKQPSAAIHTRPPIIPTTVARTIAQPQATTKSFVSRLLSHIIPAQPIPRTPLPIGRGVHTSASTTIKQSLSLPSRVALGRPFAAPFMPRGPVVVNRSVAQVGLGTARNFSSGRPIFQNLVHNVPIAARAFCEVDLDLKLKGHHRRTIRKVSIPSPKKCRETPLSPVTVSIPSVQTDEESSNEAEFAKYFSTLAPSEPYVTTLSIPLEPADIRRPLDASIDDIIAGVHLPYTAHSDRVMKLFALLDNASVWDRGVTCDCIDDAGDGLCRILRVRFEGWSEHMLRDVIGNTADGWCGIDSVPNRLPGDQSLVMPTLDLSLTEDGFGWPLIESVYDDPASSGRTTPAPITDSEAESFDYMFDSEGYDAGVDSESDSGWVSSVGSA